MRKFLRIDLYKSTRGELAHRYRVLGGFSTTKCCFWGKIRPFEASIRFLSVVWFVWHRRSICHPFAPILTPNTRRGCWLWEWLSVVIGSIDKSSIYIGYIIPYYIIYKRPFAMCRLWFHRHPAGRRGAVPYIRTMLDICSFQCRGEHSSLVLMQFLPLTADRRGRRSLHAYLSS